MGYSVCLYERGSDLGGTMRDDYVNGEPRMRGCHVLKPSVMSDVLHPWKLSSLLTESDNSVSSATWIEGQQFWSTGCEGPTIDYMPAQGDASPRPTSDAPESVQSRINRYPREVQSHLHSLCAAIGIDAINTWSPSLQALQLNRLFPLDADRAFLARLKSESPVIDDFFGMVNTSAGKVFLPVDGYNTFFAEIRRKVQASGICLHLNERVLPALEERKLVFYNSNKQRAAIGGVWCASPTILQASLDVGSVLDNSHMTHEFWHVKIRQPADPKFSYIQYFGHPQSIMRATAYAYSGVQHAVVERIRKRGQTAIPSKQHLMACAVDLGLTPIAIEGMSKAATYPLISLDDFLRLSSLEEILHGMDWIHGAWLRFGRPDKIGSIAKDIHEWARMRWDIKINTSTV